jgi:transposase
LAKIFYSIFKDSVDYSAERISAHLEMAGPYSNDLRRKFLQSYDRGKASLRELAEQFEVSLGWAKKISARRTRTGQIDFVPYRRGPSSRVTTEVEQWLRAQVQGQPDLTLAELQTKLAAELKIEISVARLWWALKDLGLRLKKSRSTHGNEIRPKRSSGGKRGRKKSKP